MPRPPAGREDVSHYNIDYCRFCEDDEGHSTCHDSHTIANQMRRAYPRLSPKQVAEKVGEYQKTPVKIIKYMDDDMCLLCAIERYGEGMLLRKWNPRVIAGGLVH